MEPDGETRMHAPATLRNRDAILAVLRACLPATGTVLEIASGSGEHAAHFAEALPALTWQPSDPNGQARVSIAGWTGGLVNVRPPIALDTSALGWPIAHADAILCINMVHISPWPATLGLFAGAARILPPGAPLILYGPYRRAGVPTAASNEAFDASLKARNPEWGLRRVEEVGAVATGFAPAEIVEMPANNLMLLFRRTDDASA